MQVDYEIDMAVAFLILGSNIGNRFNFLKEAMLMITNEIGSLKVCSSIYETEPWGFTHENLFLNQALEVSTALDPFEI